jgi:hypothetical protein
MAIAVLLKRPSQLGCLVAKGCSVSSSDSTDTAPAWVFLSLRQPQRLQNWLLMSSQLLGCCEGCKHWIDFGRQECGEGWRSDTVLALGSVLAALLVRNQQVRSNMYRTCTCFHSWDMVGPQTRKHFWWPCMSHIQLQPVLAECC